MSRQVHPLRRALEARLASLSSTVAELPQEQFEREMEALDRLERLARLAESKTAPRPLRMTWQVWGALAAVLLGLAAVTLRPRSEIDATLTAASVSFTAAEALTLNNPMTFERATFQSLARAPVPMTLPNAPAFASRSESSFTELTVARAATAESSTALHAIGVEPGTRVTIQRTADGLVLQLHPQDVTCDELTSFDLGVGGPIVMAFGPGAFDEFDAGQVKAMPVRWGCLPLQISLVTAAEIDKVFRPALSIRDPRFTEVVLDAVGEETRRRPLSSVLHGSIANVTTGAEPYALKPREWLKLVGFEGQLRTMAPADNGVALVLHGTASDILVGASESSRNIAPSLLQVMRATEPLTLFYAGTASLVAFMLGVHQWLDKHAR